mgnify:CR=1 FL=1
MDLFLLLKAFLVGGIICAIGQVLIDYTKLTPARILMCIGVLGPEKMSSSSIVAENFLMFLYLESEEVSPTTLA